LKMRNLQVSDLVGKTIKSVCCSGVNVTRLWFDDGTNISIWAEIVDPIGIAGLVVYDEYPENHICDTECITEKMIDDIVTNM